MYLYWSYFIGAKLFLLFSTLMSPQSQLLSDAERYSNNFSINKIEDKIKDSRNVNIIQVYNIN